MKDLEQEIENEINFKEINKTYITRVASSDNNFIDSFRSNIQALRNIEFHNENIIDLKNNNL